MAEEGGEKQEAGFIKRIFAKLGVGNEPARPATTSEVIKGVADVTPGTPGYVAARRRQIEKVSAEESAKREPYQNPHPQSGMGREMTQGGGPEESGKIQ